MDSGVEVKGDLVTGSYMAIRKFIKEKGSVSKILIKSTNDEVDKHIKCATIASSMSQLMTLVSDNQSSIWRVQLYPHIRTYWPMGLVKTLGLRRKSTFGTMNMEFDAKYYPDVENMLSEKVRDVCRTYHLVVKKDDCSINSMYKKGVQCFPNIRCSSNMVYDLPYAVHMICEKWNLPVYKLLKSALLQSYVLKIEVLSTDYVIDKDLPSFKDYVSNEDVYIILSEHLDLGWYDVEDGLSTEDVNEHLKSKNANSYDCSVYQFYMAENHIRCEGNMFY